MLYASVLMHILCAWNRDWPKFDIFVRERLLEVLPMLTFPADGTVFDYFVDSRNGNCIRWNERSLEKFHSFAISGSYVVIPEVSNGLYCDYIHFLQFLVSVASCFTCTTTWMATLKFSSLKCSSFNLMWLFQNFFSSLAPVDVDLVLPPHSHPHFNSHLL